MKEYPVNHFMKSRCGLMLISYAAAFSVFIQKVLCSKCYFMVRFGRCFNDGENEYKKMPQGMERCISSAQSPSGNPRQRFRPPV